MYQNPSKLFGLNILVRNSVCFDVAEFEQSFDILIKMEQYIFVISIYPVCITD